MSFDPDHWLERHMRWLEEMTEKMEKSKQKVDRFFAGCNLFMTALLGGALACCPFAVFHAHSCITAAWNGTPQPPPTRYPIVAAPILIPIALIPLLVIDTCRAARALGDEKVPPVLWWMPISVVFVPFVVAPLVAEFGSLASFAVLVWWPIATLSPAAFTVAAAQIEAERRGEEVRTTAVNLLWHAGGFVGVILAMRMFRESKAIEEFDTGFPRLMGFILIGIVLLAVTGVPDVPGGAPWELLKP